MKISEGSLLFGTLLITLSITGCGTPPLQNNVMNGKIVFQSAYVGNYDLYIVKPDGSGKRNLTNGDPSTTSTNNNFAPVPSPNGTQIAFISDRDDNNEIYVIDIENETQVNLTKNNANEL